MYMAIATFPVTVLGAVISARHPPDTGVLTSPPSDLDAIADALAMAVRSQLETEERIRRIHDPFPLLVRWRSGPAVLMDHWQSINGSVARRGAISLAGHGDHVADLFAQLPSRRLVVLGRAGAGKTIVASRFVLTLLDRRAADRAGPVPIPLSAGAWNPAEASLREWAAQQLAENYPVLALRDPREVTFATRLLETRRVMLVMDGFDEISDGLRSDAIRQINAGLGQGDWFMLTSRPGEYAAAVATSDVLTAGAVIELRDLTAEDVAAYLPLTARKERPGTTRTKWHPVVARLRRPGGSVTATALRAALSTPLMVALARASYSDTDADPAELIDDIPGSGADPDFMRAQLENHLLASFIPAVYAQARQRPEDDSRSSRSVADALRWLRFLAAHMDRLQTQNLAWWQLPRAVPQPAIIIATSTAVALPILAGVGLGRWIAHWTAAGATIWTVGGLVFAFLSGLVAGVLAATGRAMRPAPSQMRLRFRGQLRRVVGFLATELFGWRAAAWIGTWTASGFTCGLIARFTLRNSSEMLSGTVAGLVVGFGLWFIVALVQGLAVIVDPAEAAGPADLLRSDRATGLRQGLITGAFGAALVIAVVWQQFDYSYHLVSGALFWVIAWVLATLAATGMWILPGMVWGPWLIARTWLALRGYLPWDVMAFLDDAHHRGILRQAGGVYQFRHARLQRYLATQQLSPRPVPGSLP
jgi:NACHT domain